jgi:hypothetical protein
MQVTNTVHNGRMAQRLRHPPTERGIPGSNPGVIGTTFCFHLCSCMCVSQLTEQQVVHARALSRHFFYAILSVTIC